ncbi:hypothetical protein ACT2CV_07990 [Pasteurellaceae bacterium 22721_9_1]
MVYELKTELGYQIRYFQADDEPAIDIAIQPKFNGYHLEGDECTVFDFLALSEEMNNNTSYYPITCECGMPDDAAIYSPLTQTVTEFEIYWDIPIADYRWTVSPEYSELDGVLRLIFDKQQFQQTVLQMNTEARSLVENGVEIATIKPEQFIKLYGSGDYFLDILQTAVVGNPLITHAKVGELHPFGGISATKVFD